MRQSYQVIYNAMTNYGRTLIQGIAGFLLIPFVVHRIGQESYGVVLLAMAAFVMVELCGQGLSKAVIKHFAEQEARGNRELLKLIFNSSLLWFFTVGAIGSAIIFFVGAYFESCFKNIPPELIRQGQLSMYIIAAVICPCLILDIFKGILSARQRYDIVNLICTSIAVTRVLLIVGYFGFIQPSLIAVVIIYAITYIAERLAHLLVSYRIVSVPAISLSAINREGIRLIVGFASMILVITAANMLVTNIIKFIIASKLSLTDVTHYGIILLLIGTANMLVRNFVNVLVPVVSKYQGLENYDVIQKMFLHGTKYAVIIVVASIGVTMPFLPGLLRLWMGPEFEHLWSIGIVMFIGQIIGSSSVCANQILSGLGKVRFIAIAGLICAVSGLSMVWVYLHYWPSAILLGVAILMVIYRTIVSGSIFTYGIKVIGGRWQDMLAKAIAKPVLIGGLVALLGVGFVRLVGIESWLVLVFSVFVTEVIFLMLTYLWCLDKEEKCRGVELLQKTYSKVTGNS